VADIDTSIVIATCSRVHLLRGALDSLLVDATSWRMPVELIVVDDGSTDETPALLSQIKRTSSIPVTILAGERRGVAAARNLGAAHARGKWLASFDDDQIALPGWLASLRDLAEEKNVACVGGPLELSLPQQWNLSHLGPRVRRVLGELLAGDVPRQGVQPATNNVLIRRDIFEHLGGYDVSFTEGAEDADFFSRLLKSGHAIWFQPAAKALHITPEPRLQRSNLRWTSIRLGAGDARRTVRNGQLTLLRLGAARILVATLRDVPQLIIAKLKEDTRMVLDVECSLWYTQGLLRALPAFLGAKHGKSEFLQSLDFRRRNGERKEATVR
jgi:GT2 family glycosyltransferase